MTFAHSVHILQQLAETGEHGGAHASLNPYFIGGATLLGLLALLWITTRFNRDR